MTKAVVAPRPTGIPATRRGWAVADQGAL